MKGFERVGKLAQLSAQSDHCAVYLEQATAVSHQGLKGNVD